MIRKVFGILVAAFIIVAAWMFCSNWSTYAETPTLRLGNEMLMDQYHELIEGKKIGLVTNQSGVTSRGESLIDALASDPSTHLVALYGPEHGIDGP